jgi:hypothetical protein
VHACSTSGLNRNFYDDLCTSALRLPHPFAFFAACHLDATPVAIRASNITIINGLKQPIIPLPSFGRLRDVFIFYPRPDYKQSGCKEPCAGYLRK